MQVKNNQTNKQKTPLRSVFFKMSFLTVLRHFRSILEKVTPNNAVGDTDGYRFNVKFTEDSNVGSYLL